jgi:hypothetical protein
MRLERRLDPPGNVCDEGTCKFFSSCTIETSSVCLRDEYDEAWREEAEERKQDERREGI